MELGEKLLHARLAAGLSQRKLCEGIVTRNMLSQIEHGSARPSMDTLRALAERLGKPVSFFLEEDAVELPNREVMRRARQALAEENPAGVLEALAEYGEPDEIFDREKQLLVWCATLDLAEQALTAGRNLYALELLAGLTPTPWAEAQPLERQRTLLLAKAKALPLPELVKGLPSLDEELLLRAQAAVEQGDGCRAGALLDAAENRTTSRWSFLRGQAWLLQENWQEAGACLHLAEAALPGETAPLLERCYRELGDYKRAYEYACLQKAGGRE